MTDGQTRLTEYAHDIVYGSIAGMAGKVIEYPFDTIKVRLQVCQRDFNGPLDCFLQGIRLHGFAGFYRGISSPLAGAMAENAILFASYQYCQQILAASSSPSPALSVVSGAIAGACASFVLTPFELIKCRSQVNRDMSMLQFIRQVYRDNGTLGFWRGQTGTLLRETCGSAAWFGAYAFVLSLLTGSDPEVNPTLLHMMTAGAVGGMSYNGLAYPVDTIKSKMQVNHSVDQTRHFFKVTLATWQEGGLKSFYRGCGITVARAAPSSAVIFAVYESIKRTAT